MDAQTDSMQINRRTVLQGAGAAAFVGLTVSTGSAAADQDTENGENEDQTDSMLVLVYDDSPREDYTKTFPVHQEHDVPGCAAVCPGLMGTDSAYMHPGHLEEMYEAGWEVMSHTMEHRSLGEIPVRSDIQRGDTEIHMQRALHGGYPGDPVRIFNGNQEVSATVAGREIDGDREYLVLEEPIDESFDAGDEYETWVGYPEEFIRDILEESKQQIEEWGFGPVNAYVHTYNRYDGTVSELVPEYYDAVPNRHGNGLNPTFDPDPMALGRNNFEDDNMSDSELEDFLDVVANEPDFGILYGHSNLDAFTAERIDQTIELAKERDIEIVTLHDALTRLDAYDDGSPDDDDESGDGDDHDDVGEPGPTDDGDDGIVDRISGGIQSFFSRIGSALRSFVSSLRDLIPLI